MAFEALGLPLPPSPGGTARSPSPFSPVAGSVAPLSSGGLEVQGSSPRELPAPGSQQHVQSVVQKAELSLKVMVAAGTACAFHIGGSLESSIDDSTGVPVSRRAGWVRGCSAPPAWQIGLGRWHASYSRPAAGLLSVQRWEFFIGDPPQPKEPDSGAGPQPRPPIAQLQSAEQHAISGPRCETGRAGHPLLPGPDQRSKPLPPSRPSPPPPPTPLPVTPALAALHMLHRPELPPSAAGEAVLTPEVVAMVGPTCLLNPLQGGNARLLQLLQPYQMPPEVGLTTGRRVGWL